MSWVSRKHFPHLDYRIQRNDPIGKFVLHLPMTRVATVAGRDNLLVSWEFNLQSYGLAMLVPCSRLLACFGSSGGLEWTGTLALPRDR
eukprot:scaffold656_cov403-Pavlova_lutheri.AAC.19